MLQRFSALNKPRGTPYLKKALRTPSDEKEKKNIKGDGWLCREVGGSLGRWLAPASYCSSLRSNPTSLKNTKMGEKSKGIAKTL
jgi:hypothetical protein